MTELVSDQFEEIFTIGKNHPEREALAEELYYLVVDHCRIACVKNFRKMVGEIQKDILRHFYPKSTFIDDGLEVEPSLLSLLCYQMVEKGISPLSKKEKDNIIADFYYEELKRIPNSPNY